MSDSSTSDIDRKHDCKQDEKKHLQDDNGGEVENIDQDTIRARESRMRRQLLWERIAKEILRLGNGDRSMDSSAD